jgi:sodium/potassium/calcium exchanger 6
MLVLCVPLHFIFAVTVPILEHIGTEVERKTGYFSWRSKHLLALNLLIDPLFIAWGVGGVSNQWGSFPVWAACLIIGFVISVLSLLVTNPDRPPRFFQILGPLSFVTSVLWIYFLAGELVSLIEVIGIVFGVSETLLGLTVLAWGNSIGGLIVYIYF